MKLVQTGADPRLAGGRLSVDLAALAANWRDLARRSKPAKCAAVVKADAYGLGVEHVVPVLLSAGCETFFVALPEEGVAVRRIAPRADIFILNGVHEMSAATLSRQTSSRSSTVSSRSNCGRATAASADCAAPAPSASTPA
jgi:alanine racemase